MQNLQWWRVITKLVSLAIPFSQSQIEERLIRLAPNLVPTPGTSLVRFASF